MFWRRFTACIVAPAVFFVLTQPPQASSSVQTDTITVPVGTKVYCELKERVVSKKKANRLGTQVDVQVWRDVLVDGRIVIPKGTSIVARIDKVKSAKVAGISGKVEIAAHHLVLADGHSIALKGGFGKKGKGSIAASVALAALVAWPLIFIPGSKAVLKQGTVFDAYTSETFEVPLDPGAAHASKESSPLNVGVLYDDIRGRKKLKTLPMSVTLCQKERPAGFVIDRLDGAPLKKPIPVTIDSHEEANGCHKCRVSVPFKRLAKQIQPGINWFDVAYQQASERVGAEVVLDLQF